MKFKERHGLSMKMTIRTLLIMLVMLPHAIVRQVAWALR